MKGLFETIPGARYHLQKTMSDCAGISTEILNNPHDATAEASLWVQLEGTFDDWYAESVATRLGILRLDKKGQAVSDLHGIMRWPYIRVGIRAGVIMWLLVPSGNAHWPPRSRP